MDIRNRYRLKSTCLRASGELILLFRRTRPQAPEIGHPSSSRGGERICPPFRARVTTKKISFKWGYPCRKARSCSCKHRTPLQVTVGDCCCRQRLHWLLLHIRNASLNAYPRFVCIIRPKPIFQRTGGRRPGEVIRRLAALADGTLSSKGDQARYEYLLWKIWN